MTKHEAVEAYFRSKAEELAAGAMGYNYTPETPYQISLVTIYSDKIRKKYLIGAEKEYGFAIFLTRPYSTDSGDDLNLSAMNFAQSLMDWIEEQNREKAYPAFPEGCQIKKMECLQNMPNLSGVNAEEGIAQYMVQCNIIYFEQKGGTRE